MCKFIFGMIVGIVICNWVEVEPFWHKFCEWGIQ